MEALVTIIAVGAYAERQYQKQDGSSEYFKSRDWPRRTVTRSSSRECPTSLRASGSIARGRTRMAMNDMRMRCTSQTCRISNNEFN